MTEILWFSSQRQIALQSAISCYVCTMYVKSQDYGDVSAGAQQLAPNNVMIKRPGEIKIF